MVASCYCYYDLLYNAHRGVCVSVSVCRSVSLCVCVCLFMYVQMDTCVKNRWQPLVLYLRPHPLWILRPSLISLKKAKQARLPGQQILGIPVSSSSALGL